MPPSGVPRVALSRLPGERVRVVGADGERELPASELAAHVAEIEQDGARWVWDDTARWYPPLLGAGVRVARCHDLRLSRRILTRAPAVDRDLLEGDDADLWDRLGPAVAALPTLFPVDDRIEHLDAGVEDGRQLTAVAASSEAGRLRLLLAAESAGALAAAEMTHAGIPWSREVHERILDEQLGPRPPRGARPAELEALANELRELLRAPGLNPDSRPELLAALQRSGLTLTDVRASTLRRQTHPCIEPLLRYKRLAHLFSNNGWEWIDQWVRGDRLHPAYQPAGSSTGRWSSNGGGALSIPMQVRPAAVADEGWCLVVADVAQLEPRVLAGMSNDHALAGAARGADLYQAIVDDGAVASRAEAKVGMLGALYGATTGDSGRMLPALMRRYPRAMGLVEDAARAGERAQVVRTQLGRGSTIGGADDWGHTDEGAPADPDAQASRRRSWGRFTRNFVVQGTGAEWALCWIAELRNSLWRLGGQGALTARPHLVFFLHDEVVVHAPSELADKVTACLTEAAASAASLVFPDVSIDFPLNVAVVRSYAEPGK